MRKEPEEIPDNRENNVRVLSNFKGTLGKSSSLGNQRIALAQSSVELESRENQNAYNSTLISSINNMLAHSLAHNTGSDPSNTSSLGRSSSNQNITIPFILIITQTSENNSAIHDNLVFGKTQMWKRRNQSFSEEQGSY